ncbi:cyclase family protein [Fusobacterium sp. MFO224]|uniref:cyclase family protein n=1 Tax=Fusobacterium sp. MFO224 TaxID=3378070 RepID=UPI0038519CC3
MIDITLKLDKDNKIWKYLEDKENKFLNGGHIGTHVDVYKKSSIPLKYFKTEGVLIDCTEYDLDKEIEIEALKNIKIKEGNFVIFKTNTEARYSYGSNEYFKKHPQLSLELIDYLLEKKIAFIGVDCAGIRRGKEHVKADIKAEENNVYIIENLDLSHLNTTIENSFDIYTMWIDNPFSTGLPTKVLVDIL